MFTFFLSVLVFRDFVGSERAEWLFVISLVLLALVNWWPLLVELMRFDV